MKKIIPLLLMFGLCLWAADFWKEKPFTDWTAKDIQKMEGNSPWSKVVTVSLGGGGQGGGSSRGGRGGGRGGDSDSGGMGGGAGLTLTVSWRTALPVREAFAKQKFGAEAETSPDAKKLLGEEQKSYVVLVSGLPGRTFRGDENTKETLAKSTSLVVKGKDPIAPEDVQTGSMNQKAVVVFIFPRKAIDLDDKEVEFSSKIGRLVVKEKFRLKDMVYKGKLEL